MASFHLGRITLFTWLAIFAIACKRPGITASSDAGAVTSSVDVSLDASMPSQPSPSAPRRAGKPSEETVGAKCPAGMAFLPARSAVIGSEKDWIYGAFDPDMDAMEKATKPAHTVNVSGFCIDTIPVAVEAYRKCVLSGQCSPPAATSRNYAGGIRRDKAETCNWSRHDHEQHPVDCVDQAQAKRYCEQQGRRLPTEVEWELSAQGLAASNQGPTCNFAAANEWTCPIASYPSERTASGVQGMMLAAEWTASPYCAYPKHDCKAANAVLRGRVQGTAWETISVREAAPPSWRHVGLTFRCATDTS